MQLSLSPGELPSYFNNAMNGLTPSSKPLHLAIACSGGPDSRALVMLAHGWASASGHRLSVLIVDHGLRTHSANEAEATRQWATTLGLHAVVLSLAMDKSANAIQQRARCARYAAMGDWCEANSAEAILLGHQADDQIETTLFRLLRGSGIHGLAAMSAKSHRHQLNLYRPLLAIPKQTLLDYLTQHHQPWIDDPSNRHTAFARIRIRHWLAKGATDEQRKRLWRFAQRCGYIRQQDEQLLNETLIAQISLAENGIAMTQSSWFALPSEQAIWSLKRILVSVNGDESMSRQTEVERLYDALMSTPEKARSLNGCLIFEHHQQLVICREPARCEGLITLESHKQTRWDKRFTVISGNLPKGCQLGPLAEHGVRIVKDKLTLPRAAALSLPTIWYLEAPVCVPHIHYYHAPEWKARVDIRFAPAKALAAAPFFIMNEEAKNKEGALPL